MRGSGSTRRVARLAARQQGNVTTAQLRDAGLTDAQIHARVSHGWLVRRHRHVYAVGHVPRDRRSRWHAAALALDGIISHRTAAAFWRLLDGAVPTEVIVAPGAGHRHRDGIVVHRATLRDDEWVLIDGARVATVLRTVLDAAAVLPPRSLERLFEEAQVRHALSPVDVGVEVLSRAGHRGNAKLRVVLDGAVDPTAVRSVLELRFLKLCAAHGIRRPAVNTTFGPWLPDFCWLPERVIVETDGVAFHRTAAARRRDARKDAYFRAQGFVVIRLTWTDVHARPARCAELVAAALARGAR